MHTEIGRSGENVPAVSERRSNRRRREDKSLPLWLGNQPGVKATVQRELSIYGFRGAAADALFAEAVGFACGHYILDAFARAAREVAETELVDGLTEYLHISGRFRSEAKAREIAVTSVLRLRQKLQESSTIQFPKTWLRSEAGYRAKDAYRRLRREERHQPAGDMFDVCTNAGNESIETLLDGAPARVRESVWLRAEGKSFEEIAQIMNVTKATVLRYFRQVKIMLAGG